MVVGSEVDGSGWHSHHPGNVKRGKLGLSKAPQDPGPPLPHPAKQATEEQGRDQQGMGEGPGYSQCGWEATPQGPGALMSHNLYKGILAKQTPAQGEEG